MTKRKISRVMSLTRRMEGILVVRGKKGVVWMASVGGTCQPLSSQFVDVWC